MGKDSQLCFGRIEFEAVVGYPRGNIEYVYLLSSSLFAKYLGHSEQTNKFVQSI